MPDALLAVADAPAADGFFAFEADFVASLRCIPMSVRLKLDRAGIKLSLRQWSCFTRLDRQALVDAPCRSGPEIDRYAGRLVALVRDRAGETAKPLPEPVDPQWEGADRPPPAVVAFANGQGLAAPTPRQWAALSELQRFALVKLSRDNHDNVNFMPAMREFGLLAD
ncbi:MAG TPA: nitrate reductase associated protein [Caulobacteraceae bacterium]|jgi:hypothetical protein